MERFISFPRLILCMVSPRTTADKHLVFLLRNKLKVPLIMHGLTATLVIMHLKKGNDKGNVPKKEKALSMWLTQAPIPYFRYLGSFNKPITLHRVRETLVPAL